jgi:DNA-binding transcriptional LysR family regulator
MYDELSDLRLFTKMVSTGSLSETARRLNTSLTAMSRRLAQMEEQLGVRLIDRGSRRFSLTEEGELLFRICL